MNDTPKRTRLDRYTITSIAAVVSAIVLLLVGGCTRDDPQVAHKLLQSGDFLGARVLYSRIIEKHPDNFVGQYGVGMTWCAEAIYKTDLGLVKPEDWYPAIYHVSLAWNLGGKDEVRKTLAVLHFNLGAEYRKRGNTIDAIDRMEQALSYDTTLFKALNLLGAMYHENGDFDNAEKSYLRAVKIRPDYALAWFNLGAVKWAENDLDSALVYFEKAAELDKGNQYYLTWKNKALEQVR